MTKSGVNRRYQNNGVGPVGVPDTIRFTVNFNTAAADFIPELYIFRTNDRGHEVHRSGFPRTSTIKPGLFNTQNDAGDYKTSTGIPWAMEIVTNNKFKCAIEKIDILIAYPKFKSWAESNGVQNPTWYLEPVADKVVNTPFNQ